uniref:Uncharacterized protein n=1 Tax=Meloidogyne floridensis TaxID=298350 RepID=A0A915NMR6_9BILA
MFILIIKQFLIIFILIILLFPPSFYSIVTRKRKLICKRTPFNRKTTNYKAWREQMTICELLENYDPAVRPLGQIPNAERRGPVIVTTSLFVNSISAVSERNMEYVVQFRFQQQWLDERLAFKMSEAADLQQINLARDQPIWIPDSFFQNERSGHYHMLDQENRFVQVDVDGRVTYNRRLTLTLAYAYTKNDIIYQWDNVGIEISDTANGALPNFEIASLDNDTCDSDTNTGVSWVSYWIDWKSTAARVPLAIVTLLTMITQSHAINSNLPPVSYAKSIDIWIGGCVVFIFASLIEYAIVNYMGILEEHKQMRKITMNRTRLSNVLGDQVIPNFDEQPIKNLNFPNEKRSLLRKQRKMQVDLRFEDQEDEQTMELSNVNNNASQEHKELFQNLVRWCSLLNERGRAERIDIIARILFPLAFALFNGVYWKVYLNDVYDQHEII